MDETEGPTTAGAEGPGVNETGQLVGDSTVTQESFCSGHGCHSAFCPAPFDSEGGSSIGGAGVNDNSAGDNSAGGGDDAGDGP